MCRHRRLRLPPRPNLRAPGGEERRHPPVSPLLAAGLPILVGAPGDGSSFSNSIRSGRCGQAGMTRQVTSFARPPCEVFELREHYWGLFLTRASLDPDWAAACRRIKTCRRSRSSAKGWGSRDPRLHVRRPDRESAGDRGVGFSSATGRGRDLGAGRPRHIPATTRERAGPLLDGDCRSGQGADRYNASATPAGGGDGEEALFSGRARPPATCVHGMDTASTRRGTPGGELSRRCATTGSGPQRLRYPCVGGDPNLMSKTPSHSGRATVSAGGQQRPTCGCRRRRRRDRRERTSPVTEALEEVGNPGKEVLESIRRQPPGVKGPITPRGARVSNRSTCAPPGVELYANCRPSRSLESRPAALPPGGHHRRAREHRDLYAAAGAHRVPVGGGRAEDHHKGPRISLATNAQRVCAEITLKQRDEIMIRCHLNRIRF